MVTRRNVKDFRRLADASRTVYGASDPVLVNDVERQRVLSWNQSARDLLGYEESEVIGRSCYEVLRGRDDRGEEFCCPGCDVVMRVRHSRSPVSQELIVSNGAGCPLLLYVSTFVPGGNAPNRGTLIHVLIDIGRERRMAALIEETVNRHYPVARLMSLLQTTGNSPLTSLTKREMEVLAMLAKGMGTPDIAAALFISQSTVRNHIDHLLHKLGVRSRVEALALVLGGARSTVRRVGDD
jgi:DNA-binding CsgD family transcriptional regulator